MTTDWSVASYALATVGCNSTRGKQFTPSHLDLDTKFLYYSTIAKPFFRFC